MIREVEIKEIIDNKNIIFIDVRSEKEYSEDTIPGAINLPILNDKEREYIGYIYKQVDKEKAKELGLEYASKKLADYYKKIKEFKRNGHEIALFCYRGGMRSTSLANVLNIMGLDILLIKGGYKEYRRYVLDSIDREIDKYKLIVLHGHTGVGKSKILKSLKDREEDVIDLEYLAQNSGSVFGNIIYGEKKITQKLFESMLFQSLINLKSKYVFIESESKRIGTVNIPESLHNKMKNGYHILIETSLNNRIENIYSDYVNIKAENKDKLIIQSLNKLRRRLGNNIIDDLIDKINNDKYKDVIEKLMLEYYDPYYKYSIDKIEKYDMIIKYNTIEEATNQLQYFKKLLLV